MMNSEARKRRLGETVRDAEREMLEEIARLKEELERTQRGAKTLGSIVEAQCRDILNITGLHHMIDEDGDGDWGAVWENALALLPERDDLRRRLAAVEALAEKWQHQTFPGMDEWEYGAELRAALRPDA